MTALDLAPALPGWPPVMAAAPARVIALTASRTAVVCLGDTLIDDPAQPFPHEWHAALRQLRARPQPASAAVEPWPSPHDESAVVLRQSIVVDGVPVGDLVAIGAPADRLEARARLLRAYAGALAALLRVASPHATPADAASALDASALVTVPFEDLAAVWRPDGPIAEWILAAVARLLGADCAAAHVSTAQTAQPAAGETAQPAAADTGTYVEAPPTRGHISHPRRRALAEAIAHANEPVVSATVPPGFSAADVGARDLIGVPLPLPSRLPAALLLLRDHGPAFDSVDVDAASIIAERFASHDAPLDRAAQFDALRAAESRRLAGDLHDGPVQQLSSAVLESEVALKLLQRDPAAAASSIEQARDSVRDVITQLRGLIFDLRLANVAELGLAGALKACADDFSRNTGVRVDLHIDAPGERLPASVETGAFLIAREALANVRKHAQATSVSVALSAGWGGLHLRIEDDGAGFLVDDAFRDAARDKHFGLVSMRDRADGLRGSIRITSRPAAGTLVDLTVPRTEIRLETPLETTR